MNYTNPCMVVSPKASIKELEVVYDGGAQTDDQNEWHGWAIATFKWDGVASVGVRWNGIEGSVGNPQSRGVPTWFVLPEPLAKIALQAARAGRGH